jgi:hypothetical protein
MAALAEDLRPQADKVEYREMVMGPHSPAAAWAPMRLNKAYQAELMEPAVEHPAEKVEWLEVAMDLLEVGVECPAAETDRLDMRTHRLETEETEEPAWHRARAIWTLAWQGRGHQTVHWRLLMVKDHPRKIAAILAAIWIPADTRAAIQATAEVVATAVVVRTTNLSLAAAQTVMEVAAATGRAVTGAAAQVKRVSEA